MSGIVKLNHRYIAVYGNEWTHVLFDTGSNSNTVGEKGLDFIFILYGN